MANESDLPERATHRSPPAPVGPIDTALGHADPADDRASGTGSGFGLAGAVEQVHDGRLVPLDYAALADDDRAAAERPLYAGVGTGLLSLVVAAACGVTSLGVGYYAIAGFRYAHQLVGLAVGLGFATFMGFGAVALGLVAWEELFARPARTLRARRSSPYHRDRTRVSFRS